MKSPPYIYITQRILIPTCRILIQTLSSPNKKYPKIFCNNLTKLTGLFQVTDQTN